MTFCGTDLTDHRLDTYRLIAEVVADYRPAAKPEATLRSFTETMQAMLAGEDVAPEALQSLMEFCTLLSEASLQRMSSPGCGTMSRLGERP